MSRRNRAEKKLLMLTKRCRARESERENHLTSFRKTILIDQKTLRGTGDDGPDT